MDTETDKWVGFVHRDERVAADTMRSGRGVIFLKRRHFPTGKTPGKGKLTSAAG
jgi:hypothetical protein